MSLTIGQRLKSAREAKGIGLGEAVQATKIQRKTLEAIEQDQLDEILEPAYARIFLKKYAVYLSLDGAALTEEYMAGRGPLPQASLSVKTEVTKKEETPGLLQILLPAGIGLVGLVGLCFLGFLALDFYGSLHHGKEAPRAVHKKPKVLPAVERVSPGPKLIVPKSQPLRLTVRARGDVWMQIKSDGSVIFQNVLHRGDTESWTAKEELEIWTGNAGAMELLLNGKPLGEVGGGVKKGLKITHEGVKE